MITFLFTDKCCMLTEDILSSSCFAFRVGLKDVYSLDNLYCYLSLSL